MKNENYTSKNLISKSNRKMNNTNPNTTSTNIDDFGKLDELENNYPKSIQVLFKALGLE